MPVALSVRTALLNIILDALLSRPLGLVGLALAHSISVTAGSLVGLYLLKRMLSGLALGPLAGSVLRALASSVIMGAGAVLVSRYTGFAAGSGSLVRDALAGGISIAVSGVIYVLASHVFRSEEISMVFGLVKQRLGARFGRDRSES